MSERRPTALITGAARGIGAAIVREMARDHDVIFTYLGAEESARALASELTGVTALQCDFARPEAPAKLMAEVAALSPRLDLLVNAAGAAQEEDPLALDPASIERQMRINALAPAALTSLAGNVMQPGSAVINITSVNATFPPAGALTYGASKAALENYTRGFAKALGPKGIRVNAIAPGAVERDHAPRPAELVELFTADAALGSLATPEDIAQAVRFLAVAQGVTGAILPVSRGFRL